MTHVFISYSHKDREYARLLADDLIEKGFDVWIDDRIDYGDQWFDAIIEAIEECSAFVIIMTTESKVSDWVKREMHLAEKQKKAVLPLLLEGKIWEFYVHKQAIDVSNGKLPPSRFYDRIIQFAPKREPQGKNVTPSYRPPHGGGDSDAEKPPSSSKQKAPQPQDEARAEAAADPTKPGANVHEAAPDSLQSGRDQTSPRFRKPSPRQLWVGATSLMIVLGLTAVLLSLLVSFAENANATLTEGAQQLALTGTHIASEGTSLAVTQSAMARLRTLLTRTEEIPTVLSTLVDVPGAASDDDATTTAALATFTQSAADLSKAQTQFVITQTAFVRLQAGAQNATETPPPDFDATATEAAQSTQMAADSNATQTQIGVTQTALADTQTALALSGTPPTPTSPPPPTVQPNYAATSTKVAQSTQAAADLSNAQTQIVITLTALADTQTALALSGTPPTPTPPPPPTATFTPTQTDFPTAQPNYAATSTKAAQSTQMAADLSNAQTQIVITLTALADTQTAVAILATPPTQAFMPSVTYTFTPSDTPTLTVPPPPTDTPKPPTALPPKGVDWKPGQYLYTCNQQVNGSGERNDETWLRLGQPGSDNNNIIILYDVTQVSVTGKTRFIEGIWWWEVKYQQITGWIEQKRLSEKPDCQ